MSEPKGHRLVRIKETQYSEATPEIAAAVEAARKRKEAQEAIRKENNREIKDALRLGKKK
jgi:hypothetical protein